MAEYIVTEDIRHGQYRHTASVSHTSLLEATRQSLERSPYNSSAAADPAKLDALAVKLQTRGEGSHGWARYTVTRSDGVEHVNYPHEQGALHDCIACEYGPCPCIPEHDAPCVSVHCIQTPRVYYTADVIRPDGTDTDVYGSPCEEGHGHTLESGWISPDWSHETVHEHAGDVAPDVYDSTEGETPSEWLRRVIGERIGDFETDDGRNIYMAQEDVDYFTGVTARVCAHPHGFSDADIMSAIGAPSDDDIGDDVDDACHCGHPDCGAC